MADGGGTTRRSTARTTSGRATTGSPLRCPPLSPRRPSRGRRNCWNRTRFTRGDGQSDRASCRVSCSKCGYALSRTSTRSSARNIHYYRCIGSDAWRRLGGPVCDNRPVRQDLLDQVVWTEVVRLLQNPSLIQNELDRRLAAARTAHPTKQRERALLRDLARTRKSIDRLLTAYQEDLLSLDELRQRMPEQRHREHAMQAELQSIVNQVDDRAAYLRLAETISAFLTRLRTSADSLDVQY